MPGTKIHVAHLLDHGPLTSPVATATLIESTQPELSPGESAAEVMKIAKNVRVAARFNPELAKLVFAARTPAQVAAALIKARYDLLGGARGFLGASTGPVTACPDGKGYFQHYNAGSIYWGPYTGAHEVHGAIRQKWAQLGWERSFLGYPRTDETTGNDTRHEGRFSHFERGSIYWHPSTGAKEVHGAIRAKYLELGAEASVLGYPTTDETATPDRIGRFNHFQAGSIYWTPGTGAHEVHGLIRQLWAQQGWERNPQLGYPISDELIPHRGVGYTRPPWLRKPLFTMPLDVVRLPDEQPSPTIRSPGAAIAATMPLAAAAPAQPTARVALTGRSLAALTATPALARPATGAVVRPDLVLVPPVVFNPPASHKGQSQDRYCDFENGVLFWKRGSPSAVALSPRAKAPNGDRMAWTANEIAQFASVPIRAAIGTIPGASMVGSAFVGTHGYSWDGSGTRNRPHRLRVTLQGMRIAGVVPVPALAVVEIACEVSLDPVDREIVGYLTRWRLISSQGNFLGGGDLERILHARLDPALWRQFLITKVPATADDPIAVLSVKTQPDGDVVVYFEP